MKITRIRATEVVVPAREGHVDRPEFGAPLFDRKSKWVLEVFTDGAEVGYGESKRGAGEANMRWGAEQLLGKEVRSLPWRAPIASDLSGHDMFGHPDPPVPNRLHEVDLSGSAGPAGLAFQVAVLDLWGKALGVPVHAVLGGAHREWVLTSWWFGSLLRLFI